MIQKIDMIKRDSLDSPPILPYYKYIYGTYVEDDKYTNFLS